MQQLAVTQRSAVHTFSTPAGLRLVAWQGLRGEKSVLSLPAGKHSTLPL
jgi:hypothetical protein